jgi:hypothetical protein
MGLLDIYSTINAGRPGLYGRSDAANGGAPGTVADKVATMAGHRLRANALLGGESPAPAGPVVVAAPEASAPLSIAPAEANPGQTALAMLAALPQSDAQDRILKAPPLTINYPVPPGLAMARAAAQSMRSV